MLIENLIPWKNKKIPRRGPLIKPDIIHNLFQSSRGYRNADEKEKEVEKNEIKTMTNDITSFKNVYGEYTSETASMVGRKNTSSSSQHYT